MKDLERLAPEQLKKHIMKLFNEASKKHLLITGSKGVGKSTLLKEILKDYDNYGGITTHLVLNEDLSSKTVILRDVLDNMINATVGNKSQYKMEPIINGFEDTGVNILNKYRINKELIVIDEIGFLEVNAEKYKEEIFLCFKEKKVIAVLRKEDNPLINKIKEIENGFVIDLDELIGLIV